MEACSDEHSLKKEQESRRPQLSEMLAFEGFHMFLKSLFFHLFHCSPAQLLYFLFRSAKQKMEAGGIEPPSQGISMRVSTCLFCRLFLALWNSGRQDFRRASPFFSRLRPAGRVPRPACCVAPASSLAGKAQAASPSVKRRVRSACWHFWFCQVFNEAA